MPELLFSLGVGGSEKSHTAKYNVLQTGLIIISLTVVYLTQTLSLNASRNRSVIEHPLANLVLFQLFNVHASALASHC